jgi:hypothetical protein
LTFLTETVQNLPALARNATRSGLACRLLVSEKTENEMMGFTSSRCDKSQPEGAMSDNHASLRLSRRARTSVALVSLLFGGCSFLFVDAPPKNHERLPYFECSSSRGWPTEDLILGLVYGVNFAVAAKEQAGESLAISMVAASALFLASAYSGYTDSRHCREAKEDLMFRLTRQPMYAPVPTPYLLPPYDPWLTPHPGVFGKPRPPSQPPSNQPDRREKEGP